MQPQTLIHIQRAALPELMFVPDIALALRCTHSTARTSLRKGECGPFIRIGRRRAVLRDTFFEALRQRQCLGFSPAGRGEEVGS